MNKFIASLFLLAVVSAVSCQDPAPPAPPNPETPESTETTTEKPSWIQRKLGFIKRGLGLLTDIVKTHVDEIKELGADLASKIPIHGSITTSSYSSSYSNSFGGNGEPSTPEKPETAEPPQPQPEIGETVVG